LVETNRFVFQMYGLFDKYFLSEHNASNSLLESFPSKFLSLALLQRQQRIPGRVFHK